MLGIPRQTLQYKLSSTTKPPNNWRFCVFARIKERLHICKVMNMIVCMNFIQCLKNFFAYVIGFSAHLLINKVKLA